MAPVWAKSRIRIRMVIKWQLEVRPKSKSLNQDGLAGQHVQETCWPPTQQFHKLTDSSQWSALNFKLLHLSSTVVAHDRILSHRTLCNRCLGICHLCYSKSHVDLQILINSCLVQPTAEARRYGQNLVVASSQVNQSLAQTHRQTDRQTYPPWSEQPQIAKCNRSFSSCKCSY